VELYLHPLNTLSWHGAQLKHRDNFNLLYLIRISSLIRVTIPYVWLDSVTPPLLRINQWSCSQFYIVKNRMAYQERRKIRIHSFTRLPTCPAHQLPQIFWSQKTHVATQYRS